MALNHPYIIYGIIKKNGVPQAGESVTVKNQSTNEQHTIQTDSEGKYIVTVTRTDWYPSGASSGDMIAVTALSITRSVQIDVANYPWGREVNINLITYALQDSLSFGDVFGRKFSVHRTKTEALQFQDGKNLKPKPVKAETLTFQDSFSRILSLYKTLTNTLVLSDTKFFTVSTVKTDVLSVGDLLAYTKVLHKLLSETLSLTDSETAKAGKVEAETLSLAETFTKVWTASRVKTETLSLSDSAAKTVGAVKSESLSLSDSFLKAFSKPLTETLTVQDVAAKAWSKHLTQTETLQLQDSFARTWIVYRTYTETLSLYDLIVRELFIGLIKKTLTETLYLGDSVVKKPWKSKVEILSFADSLTRLWTVHRVLSDTLTLQDSLVKTQALHKVLTDNLMLNDVILRSLIGGLIKKELVETLRLGDVQPVFALSKVLTDTVAFQDSFSRKWVLARVLTDTLVFGDSVSASMWAPIYGVMSLKPLDTDMTLYEILAELDLYFLRSVLNVKEKA